MKKQIKQDTWLPLFTGYYESFFDGSDSFIECETESSDDFKNNYLELYNAGVTYEFFSQNLWEHCNFKEAYNAASESICNGLMRLDSLGIILNIEYQSTESPKFYNFSTDSINCAITYSPQKLKDYINSNYTAFTNYITEKYTSCDGFSSSYSNDVNDWLDFEDYGEHELGSVLEFVFKNEDSEASLILYYESNIGEAFLNNTKVDVKEMIKEFKGE